MGAGLSTEVSVADLVAARPGLARRAYVRSCFADKISDEHFAIVLETLSTPEPSRWKLRRAGARKLRELTGGVFLPMKELVDQIDARATECRLFE